MRFMFSVLIFGSTFLYGATQGQEVTLEATPPVIVKTVLEAGASDVAPSTTEVRGTFNNEMRDGSMS